MATDLDSRIADLETHIAHQEKRIEELDGVVTAQAEDIARLTRQLKALAGLVADLEQTRDVAVSRPPHY